MNTEFGRFRTLTFTEGTEVPFYIVRFDRNGVCTSPKTLSSLLSEVEAGDFTDILLFSHGWNNDFPTAVASYEGFIAGCFELRRELRLSASTNYRPLAIGVYWPSAAILFGNEDGPQIAALTQTASDEFVLLDELVRQIPSSKRERLYDLAQAKTLNTGEAEELAEILLSIKPEGGQEIPVSESSSAKELVEVWKHFVEPDQPQSSGDDFGTVSQVTSPSVGGNPQTAGILEWLDPRPAIRLMTVWMMKDRAGLVGARGVGPLLRNVLSKSSAKVHLIGHSYGCKVVLSATCIQPLARRIRSMLLLQPAVSHLCFADPVPGLGKPGGYAESLQRIEQPILTTYSQHDFPLTQVFHYALRRNSDLGEVKIAGDVAPPSKFAALGGFGPRASREVLIKMHSPGQPYTFDPQVRLYGLNGSDFIKSHGDISNRGTWWALSQLVHRHS